MAVKILQGDCRDVLATLPADSVHCVVTSPPYWGLRDYGIPPSVWGGNPGCPHEWDTETIGTEIGKGNWSQGVDGRGKFQGDIREKREPIRAMAERGFCRHCGAWRGAHGLEPTIGLYIRNAVEIFREVRRVLRPDGVLFLNLGDSYFGGGRGGGGSFETERPGWRDMPCGTFYHPLKPKDLCGIPFRVAQALQEPYYTGKIKAERDRVWLAAIIDGEGTICGFTHERKDDGRVRTGANVFVTNSCEAMLAECARIWPAARYEHMMPSEGHIGTKPVNRWVPNGAEDKALLLAELLPYFVSKKQQAVVAWNLLQFVQDGKSMGRGALGVKVREQRAVLASLLSDLNQGRPYVMPSWLKDPPSLYEPGYYLRQDIIWSKPNPMPESVTDRCTKAHEYLFLLSKGPRYYFDAVAIAETSSSGDIRKPYAPGQVDARGNGHDRGGGQPRISADRKDLQGAGRIRHRSAIEGGQSLCAEPGSTRNKRSVWEIATSPFPEAHFATFPPALVEPCIKAGTSEKGCCGKCGAPWVRRTFSQTKVTLGWSPTCTCQAPAVPCTVLDCFGGAGTTALVADRLQRDGILIDLNADYISMMRRRLTAEAPLFADIS